MDTDRTPADDDLVAALAVARDAPLDDVGGLAAELYGRWYVNPMPSDEHRLDLPVNGSLVGAFAAMHVGTYRWSPGWTVRRVSNRGRVLVERGEGARVMDRIDVLPAERPCLPPRIRDVVSICERFDNVTPDGSVWMTYGPGWDPERLPNDCVRLYWNVPADAAPAFVAAASEQLSGIAHGLKLPATTDGFDRSDAAVLYLRGADVAELAPGLVALWRRVAGSLRASTPRFTRRLGRGWSAAHDPDTGESFGEYCSRIVAQSIFEAGGAPDEPLPAPIAVVERLAAHGLDPRRPWSRIGSEADLDLLDPDLSTPVAPADDPFEIDDG